MFFSKNRRRRRQSNPKEEFELHSKWFKRGIFIMAIYMFASQDIIQNFSTNNLPTSFGMEDFFGTSLDENSPLPPADTATDDHEISHFRPSITQISAGTGLLTARCGDTLSFSYEAVNENLEPIAAQSIQTLTIGQKDLPILWSHMLDGMKENENRQIILNQEHLQHILPDITAKTEKTALKVSLHQLTRATPKEGSSCTLISKWDTAIEFR